MSNLFDSSSSGVVQGAGSGLLAGEGVQSTTLSSVRADPAGASSIAGTATKALASSTFVQSLIAAMCSSLLDQLLGVMTI
ncbi:MAG: hypothetical protein F2675_04685 [Actinobacteria bacterium]|uniref:Unannotated protein n=1 Tax=freshwater metagenome TaxID=449393 RepID=A0A6J6QAT7_9ZZZZ|nr:hypothetical protein [Actinomycetota bacterium]